MKQRTLWYGVAGLGAGLLLGICWGFFRPQTTSAPTVNTANTNISTTNTNSSTNTALPVVTDFSTLDLPDRDPAFDFTAKIPTAWAVEYVAASKAINIYDPRGPAKSSLANSKIFIKYFSASSFETLTTVDILSQKADTINDHPAMRYTIKKKSGVADFPNQPDWRSSEHNVVDIRTSTASPTTFYVVAKAPEVDQATFEAVLASLTFTAVSQSSEVVYPLTDFLARITKKHFGQYITPKNSPVSPERFSGYHTGVDAEILDGEADQPVMVSAIAAGTVKLSRFVSGYGGVVMIEHTVGEQTVTALYGHLKSSAVEVKVGEHVTRGQHLGVLGAGGTAETDGERKHLHFGLLKGLSSNVKGYVSRAVDLSPWLDPLVWLDTEHAVAVTPK